ncbi:hypothetical protein [Chromohalobacter israelensis]|uniref:hypothetical protein n=1 Tax=Chromohalobacter israelensis TaxID=141390 RepID=UPI000FFF6801|nr:hypothetical protein [Chromohalobacter salexigens]RXE49199.1 hypothetical protein B4O83_14970 [Chromohalobacter salexigens]
MPIELIFYMALFIVCGGLQVYFTWSLNQWPARWVPLVPWLLVLALMLLTGCESVPERPPPPDPAPVVCTLPAGLTEQRTEPVRPAGDYTQRDVATYVTSLHAWGAEGWRRLAAANQYSRACEARHTSTGD